MTGPVGDAPPPTLNGETIDLGQLRGQVVWLNFWTTACVRRFVDELGVSCPIVLDYDSAIVNRYSPLFGVPRHCFVGRDGTIVAARIGELRPDEMEPLVRELLEPHEPGSGQVAPPSDDA